MPCAINEFRMLYKAGNCPNTVRVHSIMYNQSGTYLATSMEDLS
jgi:hypothetical protein